MKIQTCRVCRHRLSKPLVVYKNMPRAAQFFPDDKSLNSEKGEDLIIRQCLGCGLVQLDCEAVPYYREVIRSVAFSREMREFRLKQFKKWIKKYHLSGKKVLEIGCGKGEYLSLLKEAGVKAYGLEYSLKSVRFCLKNKLEAERGFIEKENYKLKNGPFGAFAVFNFLEHWPKPNDSLMGIINNLKEGAIGLIEVPNFEMILKKNLFSEFISDHLFYFTKKTLGQTLALNDLEILELKEVWHNYILSAVVRKRKRIDLSGFSKTLGKLKKEINRFLTAFPVKKVAVWGAGHQALALISLLNLGERISYVIDSAPFKQNKYTPATHLPIVGPSELESKPVEAVIVMGASYSEEIAQIIKKKYHRKIKIAIVKDSGLKIYEGKNTIHHASQH